MNTKFRVSPNRSIGAGQPVYIIAEIGINHNGSLDIAKKLIDEAVAAGCDAVKFQKRTPELCTPKDQWHLERDTPWGRMTYINYRKIIELGYEEYAAIDVYCKEKGIDWFVSCWDEESVDFMEQFNPGVYKFASASLTDFALIEKVKQTGKPYILSTGMSTMAQITAAVGRFGTDNLLIAHSTSAYPCPPQQLNLRMVETLVGMYPETPIGYSGHETGLATTVAAVSMGASFVERHFTLDRAMWGSDHAASVEPQGMQKLVRDIRDVEQAFGDGVKQVYDSELGAMKRMEKDAGAGDNSFVRMGTIVYYTTGILVLSVFIFIWLERKYPYTKGIPVFRDGFWVDLIWYTFIQSYFLKIFIFGFLIEPMRRSWRLQSMHWLDGWPVVLQVLLFLVIHDFYIYWFHRAQHHSKLLWRTHEAHHSNKEVDWLAGTRSHVVEIIINQTIEFAPIVLLLGPDSPVVAIKALIDAVWGMYIHSNIDVRSGKLQYVINGPEMHQWHHANDRAVFYANYGTKLAIWDWIFGTAYLPGRRKPAEFGLYYDYPKDYFLQHWFSVKRVDEKKWVEKYPWFRGYYYSRKRVWNWVVQWFS